MYSPPCPLSAEAKGVSTCAPLLLSLHSGNEGMENSIINILAKDIFSREDIKAFLQSQGDDRGLLFKESAEIKQKYIGNKVWFRGLIEFSNICGKDCLYCGIRKGNKNLKRYNLCSSQVRI
jgi:biotin synthase